MFLEEYVFLDTFSKKKKKKECLCLLWASIG